MRKNDIVKIIKISEQKLYSLPTGYFVEGELAFDVEIGSPIIMLRHKRNNLEILGIFNTSLINKIEKVTNNEFIVETMNSIYKLNILVEGKHDELH